MSIPKRAKEVFDFKKKKDQTYGGHERNRAIQLLNQIYATIDAGNPATVSVLGKDVTFTTKEEVNTYFKIRTN